MFAVELNNVCKVYRIYSRPSDRLKEIFFRKRYHQNFSALNNVSFSVLQGETLGIIGANGAGKSTLLKILAGTLRQSSGSIQTSGRIAALLELGAGFHPEFTGRQNIHLNASLLGLSKKEIADKEGDIIAFAELEDFIDRPVKTYSSGMYVRLAFSIATMVNPDTLIVDEALSVGDQRFQKKCVDRMMRFRTSGKTILFCSHSMYHVSQLCDKVVWIDKGSIREIGDKDRVIASYEESCREIQKNGQTAPDLYGASPVKIIAISVKNGGGKNRANLRQGDDVVVTIGIRSYERRKIHLGVGFQTVSGDYLFGVTTKSDSLHPLEVTENLSVDIVFPEIHLMNGIFQAFGVILDEHGLHVYDLRLSEPIEILKTSEAYGKVFLKHQWTFLN